MASLASFKVQWDFILGQKSRQNVISGTEQTVNEIHNRVSNADRAASRQRESDFQGHLSTLEGHAKKSGETLLKQKKQIAQKAGASYTKGATARAAKAATAPSVSAARGLKMVTQAGEKAYQAIKKRRKDMGAATGAKTFGEDLVRFSRMGQKEQKAELSIQKSQNEALEEELRLKKEAYQAGLGTGRDRGDMAADRKEIADMEMMLGERNEMLDEYNNVMKEGKPLEDAHYSRLEKLGRLEGRLKESRREGLRLEKEIARQRYQAYQEFTRQIESTSAEIGTTLRNAFVYATAAMTAFYYKLNEVNQTVMEFEKQLINAQSIWQESNETLFELSDQIVRFGLTFGIEMNEAAEGLYQYASAGVSASEAMEMLTHTLTLAMAVQGDHNTLSKLTVQIIKGFGMEFSKAEEVVDKLAHAINKSLIEWDDLASSVKFALPFYISTNQTLEELLGGMQILTDRALEAGIAGRGLRQALAEFTQHAEDSSAAFRELGVEILDVEGNMYPLHDIALQFNEVMGDSASSMDIMIALMEDLNVRGATAFIHLVQNADEYAAAVDDLENSAGEAHEMAMIQQQSLSNQILVIKNALKMPFLMSDEVSKSTDYMNAYTQQLHVMVTMFEGLIFTGAEGEEVLTELGQFMKDFVIIAMQEFAVIMMQVRDLVEEWNGESEAAYGMLSLLVTPLQVLLKILKALGPQWLNAIVMYRTLNALMPTQIIMQIKQMHFQIKQIALMEYEMAIKQAKRNVDMAQLEVDELLIFMDKIQIADSVEQQTLDEAEIALKNIKVAGNYSEASSLWAIAAASIAVHGGMLLMIYASGKMAQEAPAKARNIAMLGGAIMGMAIASKLLTDLTTKWNIVAFLAAGVAGMALGYQFQKMMSDMMSVPDTGDLAGFDIPGLEGGGGHAQEKRTGYQAFDTGGFIYADTGLAATGQHRMVGVEPGEQIISRTGVMEGGGGIVVNVGDLSVEDGTDFAEKVANALPYALRNLNDVGALN